MSDTPTLDAPNTGVPAIKFPNIGDEVTVGIVDVQQYQQRTIEGKLKTWDDGGPKMGKKVIGLVISAKNATLKDNDTDRPVVEDDLVSFYCEGSRFFTWKDALKEHGAVSVGDIMDWRFDREEPPKTRGYNPRKVYVAEIHHPTLKEQDIKQKCVDAYQELHAAADIPVDTSTDEGDDDDEDSPYEM